MTCSSPESCCPARSFPFCCFMSVSSRKAPHGFTFTGSRAQTTLQRLFSFCPWAAFCAEALQNADCHGRSVSGSTVKPWAQPVLRLHSRRVALSVRTDEPINQKTRRPVFRRLMKVELRSSVARGLNAEKERSAPAVFTSSRAIGWSKIPLQTSPCGPLICLERWGHDVKCSMTHLLSSAVMKKLCAALFTARGKQFSPDLKIKKRLMTR